VAEADTGRPATVAEEQWDEFRKTGLMWWINRQLHLFGWSLVVEVDPNDPKKTLRAFPARTQFRGFIPEAEERGFKALTAYLESSIDELQRVADELNPPSIEEAFFAAPSSTSPGVAVDELPKTEQDDSNSG